ncbi:(d)CMP kinase [Moheibacter lacus]|uniref:Cytidylate kinase n=1 Tax=Moheibacter lacus TaxID=2745851 RepID=A0A838ZRJ1_9FLAO|nr:(d)CMP kinase [Moheibacter lacus]MBA5628983.1 (d)CMP kinase [Moheibacter lacus]
MRDLIIAIDGFSSTGKSTLAKLLAKELGYIHIDSGAMYRAISLYALENGMIDGNQVNEFELLPQLEFMDIHFELNPDTGKNEIFLNGENVEEKIRAMEVSSKVSLIAKIPEVRSFAVNLQRKMGEKKRIVMDGRDIGTTVFPNADLKIFLNASAEERAKRRYEELLKTDTPATFEAVFQNISERDHIDSTREISPLKQAEDAVLVDNGKLTPQETLAEVLAIIKGIS